MKFVDLRVCLVLISVSNIESFLPGSSFKKHPAKTGKNTVALPFNEDDVAETLAFLDVQDQWIAELDYQAFGKEVSQLGKRIIKEGGEEDVRHLDKMVAWRDMCAFLGLATLWLDPNPATVLVST